MPQSSRRMVTLCACRSQRATSCARAPAGAARATAARHTASLGMGWGLLSALIAGDRHVDRRVPGVMDADIKKEERGRGDHHERRRPPPPQTGGADEQEKVRQQRHADVPQPIVADRLVHGLAPHLQHHPAREAQADEAAGAEAAAERQHGMSRRGEQGGEQQHSPEVHQRGRTEGANGGNCVGRGEAGLAAQRNHDEHQAGQRRGRRSDDDVERVPAGELRHPVSVRGEWPRNLCCERIRGQPLAQPPALGGYRGPPEDPMAAWLARCTLLPLSLFVAVSSAVRAQAVGPAPALTGATAAWTLKLPGGGEIRWQQVTPAGVLLVSTDAALAGVEIERGVVAWQKPELGGLPADSVRMVEGSLLMEAARPGLLVVFDPVTGATVFDSRKLSLTQVVTRRVLPQSGTLLVHGRRASGPPVVALFDLVTGDQRWASESLFQQTEPRRGGLGGLMQGLVRAASGATALEVLQAGPEVIVVHTLLGLRALHAKPGAVRWSATLPTARAGNPARRVQLYPSVDRPDRIYVSFDDRLMAYRLADGQALWAKPPTIEGWVHDIVQHPAGIIILPESPPADQATGNVRRVNGVVQTGLNVARYQDGTTHAAKPLRVRGTVTDALIAGGSAVLAVDAESRTFVNVLDVATASLRLKKDVKIKGQLAYAELTPAGLLYISRPDVSTNAEVNVIDLASGEPKFKDAIESGKPLSSSDYNAARYSLHHAVEGTTLYVFASHDHRLYAVDRTAGTFRALSAELKLQGDEDPVDMEIRPAGLVLIAPQNLVVVAWDGHVKQQVYYPAPHLPGLLRARYRLNAVRAGLYGAAASAYGDAFAQASRNATDSTARRITGQLATAYTQGGAQLAGYSHQAAALATKRFKASLAVPGSVFMLTRAPDGNGNVLLQGDKDSAQPRSRVDLGKQREPVYAVDDVAGMLFLRTTTGTLVGYRL